jgi:hypothetical protein
MVTISPALVDLIAQTDRAITAYERLLGNRLRPSREAEVEWKRYLDLREACRQRFARDNGWTLGKRPFSFKSLGRGVAKAAYGPSGYDTHHEAVGSTLAPLLDHTEWYVANRRPAAICGHPYPVPYQGYREAAERYPAELEAELKGLGVEVATLTCASWYLPGRTVPVLITPRDKAPKS